VHRPSIKGTKLLFIVIKAIIIIIGENAIFTYQKWFKTQRVFLLMVTWGDFNGDPQYFATITWLSEVDPATSPTGHSGSSHRVSYRALAIKCHRRCLSYHHQPFRAQRSHPNRHFGNDYSHIEQWHQEQMKAQEIILIKYKLLYWKRKCRCCGSAFILQNDTKNVMMVSARSMKIIPVITLEISLVLFV